MPTSPANPPLQVNLTLAQASKSQKWQYFAFKAWRMVLGQEMVDVL